MKHFYAEIDRGFDSSKKRFESSIREFDSLKKFCPLENGFESLKKWFKSLRWFFNQEIFWKRDSNPKWMDANLKTQKCMNVPKNTQQTYIFTHHTDLSHIKVQ